MVARELRPRVADILPSEYSMVEANRDDRI
jgi:hypothetical protein